MSEIENLKCIRDKGVKKFLEKERKKWKCLICGGVICCHNGLCVKCDFAKLRIKKGFTGGKNNSIQT